MPSYGRVPDTFYSPCDHFSSPTLHPFAGGPGRRYCTIEEGVTIDLEILDASKKLSLRDLVNISIENPPLEKVDAAMSG
jgi:hypothetical protein